MTSDRCALCPGVNACIPPDGPEDAEVLCIGEAPGPQEDRIAKKHPPGKPFIGKTGDEVNRHYLPLAGLRREHVLFINAIRCFPTSAGGKLDPTRAKDLALLECCAATHLYPLIERLRPKILVPLGAFACRAIDASISLDIHHGIPREDTAGRRVFPMYHPALGIHEPKKMLYIRTDWHRFRSYRSGRLRVAVDEWPNPDYREVTDEAEIQEIDPERPLAIDTESEWGGRPFCLTYSDEGGRGRLIRAGRPALLAALGARLEQGRGPILFHFWLHDRSVIEEMGVHLDPQRIVDTNLLIFHLGNLPQGLKAVAFRELGMEMEDFDDLVTPHSRENVLFYYRVLASQDWPKPEEQLVRDEAGQWKLYKPQSMNTKLKRFFTDMDRNPDKDVFGMFEDNWVEEQAALEAACGPYPGKCISHVPFDKTLYYACRDADATRRLYPVLRAMRRQVRRMSQEHWRAA